MKHFTLPGLAIVLVACVIVVPSVRAQAPGMPGGNVGFNAAIAKLFSDIPAFSASVETALTNASDKSKLNLPMRMLKRNDRYRLEVDLTKMQGTGLAMQGLTAMQNLGMSKMTSLVLPEEKGMVVLFPELKFFTRVPLSDGDLPSDGFQLSKKVAGRETVNGQACTRFEVTLTGKDGEKTQATTWEAASLGNFPIRMVFKPNEDVMRMDFRDVILAPPAEDLFKVPADYKSFGSIAGLMQEALTRGLSPAGTK